MQLDFYSFSRQRLAAFLEEECELPGYRAAQLFDWVYRKKNTDFSLMTNIKKIWRDQFRELFCFPRGLVLKRQISADGSKKYLIEVSSGITVETVLIKQPTRTTLCLSSQFGCALGCAFCRTGGMGFHGNLSTGDIIRQVLLVQEDIGESADQFNNIVFMGMGEPLGNLSAVAPAVRILEDDQAFKLGPSKITISTAGVVPGIKELAAQELDVNIAVSLNATTDKLRSQLMPINKKYNLACLVECLKSYPLKPRRKITIEYVLIAEVNDRLEDLRRLIALLRPLKVKINIIPYNPIAGLSYRTPDEKKVMLWLEGLNQAGLQATIRWSKGDDIGAACGQLAVSSDRK